MAIVKMNQFTLLTFASYKENLLKEMQKFEDVHFRNLQKEDGDKVSQLAKVSFGEEESHYESGLGKVKFALQKLEPYHKKTKGIKGMMEAPPTYSYEEFDTFVDTYEFEAVYNSVKACDEKIKDLRTERSRIHSENSGLKSWLRFDSSITALSELKMTAYVVGTVNKVAAESFREQVEAEFPNCYMEKIGEIKEDACLLLLFPNIEQEELFGFLKDAGFSRTTLGFTGVPKEVIAENEKKLEQIGLAIEREEKVIESLSNEYTSLLVAHDYFEAALVRARATENFMKTEQMIVIEGWIPEAESDVFSNILKKCCGDAYYFEMAHVEKESEEVPIMLKNNKLVSAFESVTAMYSLPKYREIDPTPVLVPFYLVFFGLMVGDTGYGLLMVVGTFLALRYFHLNKGTRKFLEFFHYLGFATMLAGLVYGSFFGFSFMNIMHYTDKADGLLKMKPLLDSELDIVLMIVLSIVIGVIQIIFGLMVKGYILLRDKKIMAAIFDSLFWITTILSGIGWILAVAGMMAITVGTVSKWVFIASLVGLALTQGRESPSIGGKIGNGLYAVYGLTSYVGDIVSYTRIAALALSGSYISKSFMIMAGLIPGTISKFLFGAIILILGGLLNLGLSALGAYVHTCRLQYVEYFSKFYEGGGVPFVPFVLKNKNIIVNK